jgi:hypothetical protein
MSADLCLSVADITTGIVSHERLDLRVAGAARAFLVSCGTPDITIQVATGDLSRPPGGGKTGEKIFDSGALWQLYRDGGDLLFRFTSPAFGSVPYKTARFSPDFRRGEVSLHRPYSTTRGPVYPLEYPLDELMLTNFLAQGRGVEIHGCGVIDQAPAAPVGVRGYLVRRALRCRQDNDGEALEERSGSDHPERRPRGVASGRPADLDVRHALAR